MAQEPPAAEPAIEPAPAAPLNIPEPVPLTPATELAIPQPGGLTAIDCPNDDGSTLLLIFSLEDGADVGVIAEMEIEGEWRQATLRPAKLETLPTVGDNPQWFGWHPPNATEFVLSVDGYMHLVPPTEEALEADPQAPATWEPADLATGTEIPVRLSVYQGERHQEFDAGTVTLRESWFNTAALNNLLISIIFAIIIMAFIMAARRNPNLFIRRISGLEAVDEAIGRATEMGKPVLQVNGLDPISTLSTIAAVNILGRIARKVANYDSNLLVPCWDPVVMTVCQEVVKSAYIESGRPDAFREDSIFFLTDQQFSYVASVCGLMLREKPAANFLLGYFYAEALILAETGYSTGAIQIAGTDALAQLPFFITTCDYTLIGEELYAASAYLSREPMLLGSLKGQDVGKAFVMLTLLIGTILATCHIDWLTNLLTGLM